MADFKALPRVSALRVPAIRRISLPVSQRLSTITEGAQAPDPGRWSRQSILRASTSSVASHRTAPPPYERYPELATRGEAGANTSDEEKFARLRRTWSGATGRRGGWGRLILLVLAVLVVLGLAIGLGVGLTVGRKHANESKSTATINGTDTQSQDSSKPIQEFPLGLYSFVTTLRDQQTNCTSNPATWRCYPYGVFDSSNPSTSASSQSVFDWIIRNTSAIYATNSTTPPTPPSGEPANLTISSTNNPFAMAFAAQEMTYTSGSFASSAKLTFAFTLPKIVIPTLALKSDNAATQCFFNSTVLSGMIYLAAPPESSDDPTQTASYQQWPYAVEVIQSSPGGDGTPECYDMFNGKLGERVVQGLEPKAEEDECRCEYRNYG
jgi:hypothetical protein